MGLVCPPAIVMPPRSHCTERASASDRTTALIVGGVVPQSFESSWIWRASSLPIRPAACVMTTASFALLLLLPVWGTARDDACLANRSKLHKTMPMVLQVFARDDQLDLIFIMLASMRDLFTTFSYLYAV